MHNSAHPIDNGQAVPRAASPLLWFVAGSLLLHLYILHTWPGSSLQLQTGQGPVVIHLVEARTVAPPAPVHTATPAQHVLAPVHQRPQRKPVKSVAQAEPARAEAPPTPKTLADDTATTAALTTSQSQGPDEAAIRESLTVTIHQALGEHFRYPLLARRRGWQGEVVLAFNVESDGRISNAHIAHSSGYGVLDQAALNALGKVGRLSQPPAFGVSLQLPVIYQLEG